MLIAGAALISLCHLLAQGQELSEPAELADRAAVDVAYCMSSAYKLGLAVSARALGGSKEEFDSALRVYERDARRSFADALDDLADADAPREENELAEAQEEYFSLLTSVRDWDGRPQTAPRLVEMSRQLGERLQAICTELSLSNEERLAGAR